MLARLLKRDWLLLVLLLVVVCLIALPVLTYPLGRDQGEFATIGRGILNGRTPYTELWNPKPPAVFYVYALAMRLLGQTAMALRAIDFLVVPICSACLFWIGRRLINRRIGLWAALLFPVFYFTETFWTLTQNDGIVLVPMLLAMVLTLQVVSRQSSVTSQNPNTRWSLAYALIAGALAGYIVWYKYPFALFGVLLGSVYLWLRWQARATAPFARHDLYAIAVFIIGGIVTVGGGILFLMAQGAWGEFLRSAQVTAQYTALTFNLNDFRDLIGTAIGYRWHYWGLLFVLAVIGLVFSRQSSVASQPKKSALDALESSLRIFFLGTSSPPRLAADRTHHHARAGQGLRLPLAADAATAGIDRRAKCGWVAKSNFTRVETDYHHGNFRADAPVNLSRRYLADNMEIPDRTRGSDNLLRAFRGGRICR